MKRITPILFILFLACDKGETTDSITLTQSSQAVTNPQQYYDRVIFFGSSSVSLYPAINEAYEGIPVLQRGFGGKDQNGLYLLMDTITRRKPSQVIVICGDNDWTAKERSPSYDSGDAFYSFKRTYSLFRSQNPTAKYTFVETKISPRFYKFAKNIAATNRMIKTYLAAQKNTSYVPVNHLLSDNGVPKPHYFQTDGLHLTTRAYNEVYTPEIKKHIEVKSDLLTSIIALLEQGDKVLLEQVKEYCEQQLLQQ